MFDLLSALRRPQPEKKVIIKPLDQPVQVSDGNGKIYQASTLRSIDTVSQDEWEALAKQQPDYNPFVSFQWVL
jgi:hypothetical protein